MRLIESTEQIASLRLWGMERIVSAIGHSRAIRAGGVDGKIDESFRISICVWICRPIRLALIADATRRSMPLDYQAGRLTTAESDRPNGLFRHVISYPIDSKFSG